jgi:hypothetical protein
MNVELDGTGARKRKEGKGGEMTDHKMTVQAMKNLDTKKMSGYGTWKAAGTLRSRARATPCSCQE